MPPRRSERERGAIQLLYDNGMRPWQIHRTLHIPFPTVMRWCVRSSTQERPRRRVAPRVIRRATHLLYHGESLRSAARRLNIDHSTIWRRVRRSILNPQGLFPYRVQRRLRLTGIKKQKRLAYIRGLGASRWPRFNRLRTKVYFDQKPWELGHHPSRQNTRCWRRNRRRITTYPMDKVPSKLHCLVAINFYAKSAQPYWYTRDERYQRGMRP